MIRRLLCAKTYKRLLMRLDAKRADQTAVADLLPVPDRTAASEINVAAS
jgi:hypothetical protein